MSYFPVITCHSLRIDIFILVLSLIAFSALTLAFQFFTRKHFLLFSGLRERSVK